MLRCYNSALRLRIISDESCGKMDPLSSIQMIKEVKPLGRGNLRMRFKKIINKGRPPRRGEFGL